MTRGLLLHICFLLSCCEATPLRAHTVLNLGRDAPKVDANGYGIVEDNIKTDNPGHRRNFHQFVTRPDIDAPRFDIKVHDAAAVAPGYWFVAPYTDPFQKTRGGAWVGPHIYDSNGEVIWSGVPAFHGFDSFDFKPVTVGGEQMLSLMYRHEHGVILNASYQEIKQMSITDSVGKLNMHDFNVVDNGTRALMLKTVKKTKERHLTWGGGYDGSCTLHYYGFEEVDVQTSKPIFSWWAEGHIGLWETAVHRKDAENVCSNRDGWDYIHANAIDKFPDGDYLLNTRNTNTMFKISHTTGRIVWRFGGKKSDFEFDEKFQGQHHARVRGQNATHTLVSFLDNSYLPGGAQEYMNGFSRGFLVALRTDVKPMTATVVEKYNHPHGEYAYGRGSFQQLSNGNTFIGWTDHGLQTEYGANGKIVLEAQFKAELKSYRSYKGPWVGRPTQPPDIYAEAKPAKHGKGTMTAVWVSWNGATEVKNWRFYEATAEGETMKRIGVVARHGFETLLVRHGFASHVYAEAVDREGNVLGKSNVFETIPPAQKDAVAMLEDTMETQQPTPQVVVVEWHAMVPFVFGVASCLLAGFLSWSVWTTSLAWRGRMPWSAKPPEYERLTEAVDEEERAEENKLAAGQDDKSLT